NLAEKPGGRFPRGPPSTSADRRRELADALDPARDDVTRPEVVVGADGAGEASGRSRRAQGAAKAREAAVEEREDLGEAEPQLVGRAVLDRRPVHLAAEPQ